MDHKNEQLSEYVTTLVPTTRPNDTAAQVLQSLAGQRFDSVDSVFILDEVRKLIGVATLSDLFSAPQNAKLKDIMSAGPPVVRPDTDREDAASIEIGLSAPHVRSVPAAHRRATHGSTLRTESPAFVGGACRIGTKTTTQVTFN